MRKIFTKLMQSVLVAVLFAVSGVARADYYIVGELSGNVPPTQENAEYYKNWVITKAHMEDCKVFDVPSGAFSFYLVDGLGEDATSYGAETSVEFDETGVCKMKLVAGSTTPWSVDDWAGGRVIIGTDGNEIAICKLDSKMYLAMWGGIYNSRNPTVENAEYYSDWVLNETSEGSGVYSGKFYIQSTTQTAIAFYDRLTADEGWSASLFANKIGVDTDGTPIGFDSFGVAKHSVNIGDDENSGCLYLSNWSGGYLTFTVDINTMTAYVDSNISCYLTGGISDDVELSYENYDILKDFAVVKGGTPLVCDIPAGKFDFYISAGLTNSSETYGTAGAEISFDETGYWDEQVANSSTARWTVDNWEGGKVAFYFDGNTLKMRKIGDASSIYLIGSMNSWFTGDSWAINETAEGSGIYKGSLELSAAESMQFKFTFDPYNSWDCLNHLSVCIPQLVVDENGVATSDLVFSNGYNGVINGWSGGEIEFIVNLNEMSLTVNAGSENATKSLYLMGATDYAPIPANADALADWRMLESTTAGLYSGTFEIPAGKFDLCLFSSLTADGWNAPAYYAGTSDVEVSELVDDYGMATVDLVSMENGGRWTIEDWEGGEVSVIIDLNEQTIKFSIPSMKVDVMYVVGQFTGWVAPSIANADHYSDYVLPEIEDGVYSNTFEVSAGAAMFRFYKDLTGWDSGNSWGCQYDDGPIDYSMSGDGIFNGPVCPGKGAWSFPDWDGGKMKMTVNLTMGEVTFIDVDAAGIDDVELHPVSVVPGIGSVTVSGADSVVIYNTMGVQIANMPANGETITVALPAGLYIVNGVKVLVN